MPKNNAGADFAAIIDQNYARVYNLLLRLVGDSDTAADLTQDVFVRAFQAWPYFRGESQVYTWLYRIAVNVARNFLDRKARERRLHLSPRADEEREIEPVDPTHRPEQLAESNELGQLLLHELNRMRPEHREIIVLRDIEGLSYKEIAQILGCSIQAVKSKLFRARSVLRRRLAPYLGWDLDS